MTSGAMCAASALTLLEARLQQQRLAPHLDPSWSSESELCCIRKRDVLNCDDFFVCLRNRVPALKRRAHTLNTNSSVIFVLQGEQFDMLSDVDLVLAPPPSHSSLHDLVESIQVEVGGKRVGFLKSEVNIDLMATASAKAIHPGHPGCVYRDGRIVVPLAMYPFYAGDGVFAPRWQHPHQEVRVFVKMRHPYFCEADLFGKVYRLGPRAHSFLCHHTHRPHVTPSRCAYPKGFSESFDNLLCDVGKTKTLRHLVDLPCGANKLIFWGVPRRLLRNDVRLVEEGGLTIISLPIALLDGFSRPDTSTACADAFVLPLCDEEFPEQSCLDLTRFDRLYLEVDIEPDCPETVVIESIASVTTRYKYQGCSEVLEKLKNPAT